MKNMIFMVAAFCFYLTSQNLLANRLADPAYKVHCTGYADRDKCKKRLDIVRNHGCVTAQEYDYSLQQEKLIVPLCADDNDLGRQSDFHGWCFCSCLAKGTRIFVEKKSTRERIWLEIEKVTDDRNDYSVLVPSVDSRLSNIKLETAEIEFWSAGVEEDPIFVIMMEDMSTISVTGNHSLVLSNGKLVEGKDIRIGDTLIKNGFGAVRVTNIKNHISTDEVYNILIKGDKRNSHFFLAEGFLVGDALWENSLEDEVRSVQWDR